MPASHLLVSGLGILLNTDVLEEGKVKLGRQVSHTNLVYLQQNLSASW
jgi:hypothetical protein